MAETAPVSSHDAVAEEGERLVAELHPDRS
jgi:hypothetical protein